MSKNMRMQFFSHEWAALEDDAKANQIVDAYQSHMNAFPGSLGRKVRRFVSKHSLNGALLDHLRIYRKSRKVELVLVAGDQQVGYSRLALNYDFSRFIGVTHMQLSNILSRRNVVIRFDEFGHSRKSKPYASQTAVHRFLLWFLKFSGTVDRCERAIWLRRTQAT